VKHPARIIELAAQLANLGEITRKSFDVLVEGRFLKTSGEDRTAIELFIAGVRGWDTDLRQQIDEGRSKLD
jgi:hypothetical protein